MRRRAKKANYRVTTNGGQYRIERRWFGLFWYGGEGFYGITLPRFDTQQAAETALEDWLRTAEYQQRLRTQGWQVPK